MEIFKVQLKKVYGVFREPNWVKNQMRKSVTFCKDKSKGRKKGLVYSYDFEALEKDLLDDTIPNTPIEVYEALSASEVPKEGSEEYARCLGKKMKYTKYFTEYEYIIKDGNHRCLILEKLYVGDYMIDCVLTKKQVTGINSHMMRGLEMSGIGE